MKKMKKAWYSCARNVNRYVALVRYTGSGRTKLGSKAGRAKLMTKCKQSPVSFERMVDRAHARRGVFGRY